MGDDQSAVIAFLSNGANYPDRPSTVERIDTHASMVFLAGELAYKLKRAVRYDYLDFSTLELRQHACEAELRLNRRSAPDLYLGVRSINSDEAGGCRWDGPGTVLDWLVMMRRFPQDALLDQRAARGLLSLDVMPPLADAIARFHDGAERVASHGGRAGMAWVIDGNAAAFAEHAATLDPGTAGRVTDRCRQELARHGEQLDSRRVGGFVRRVHGDLHLRNIVMLDGRPTLFDGVEFNDEIACVDVFYDVAFLLMDLLRRGLAAHANLAFNRYVAATGDDGGLPLLPLFLACRAAVRAKTGATAARLQSDPVRADATRAAARGYLTMAERLLIGAGARLVAIGGFSGAGKSTLAARLAPQLGRAPGALILRSDLIRKSLFGVTPEAALPPAAYAPAVSERVYVTMAERAARAIEAGQSVIADAVHASASARTTIAGVATRRGVPFTGLWLDAPSDTLERRIAQRTGDASDATVNVLRAQLASGAGPLEWHRLNAAANVEDTVRRAWLEMGRGSAATSPGDR